MTQPNSINDLVEQIRTAKTMPEITRAVVLLLRECRVYNLQALGNELARISVTTGLGPE